MAGLECSHRRNGCVRSLSLSNICCRLARSASCAGGDGRVQLWMTEGAGNPQILLVYDVEFEDPSVDFGAAGYSGVQSQVVGTGVAWSCQQALSSDRSAWFGRLGQMPMATEVRSDDVRANGWVTNASCIGEEHYWQPTSQEMVKMISS